MQLTVPTLCVKKGFQKSADFWNPNLKNQISAEYAQSERGAHFKPKLTRHPSGR